MAQLGLRTFDRRVHQAFALEFLLQEIAQRAVLGHAVADADQVLAAGQPVEHVVEQCDVGRGDLGHAEIEDRIARGRDVLGIAQPIRVTEHDDLRRTGAALHHFGRDLDRYVMAPGRQRIARLGRATVERRLELALQETSQDLRLPLPHRVLRLGARTDDVLLRDGHTDQRDL